MKRSLTTLLVSLLSIASAAQAAEAAWLHASGAFNSPAAA